MLWFDEINTELFGRNTIRYIRRKKPPKENQQHTMSRKEHHGGGSILLGDCFFKMEQGL